ncbi:Meiosis-specific serine/threonine-protein kinase mek1 [Pleurotus pulmonarius]|nr:Meiosis-specific serine/threonine-protein kinase mek1 [Pleurotus pulmonarius]
MVNDDSCPRRHVCAKLVTVNKGRKEVIVLSINKPVTIGRHPKLCTYVIPDAFVSNLHCKLYAVRSGTGGIIVSCQDLSTNGLVLNGHMIRRTSVILMHGDVLEIPSSLTFKCLHIWAEPNDKGNIFDPTPPLQPIQKRVGDYVVTSHCLGSGSFATVHLAVNKYKHRQVACKTLKARKGHELSQVWKEVKILLSLNHPNINRVFDVDQNGNFLHIFLELCTGGDLFTYIISHQETENRLCEGEAKYIMFQLLKGLTYLHDKLISHRGMRISLPENILLYTPGPYPRIQIADFGLARPKAYQETLNVCGTVSYLPPEGILALDNKHLGYVGMPSDCWSAGVILFIMLSGFHPFDYDASSDSDWLEVVPDSQEPDLQQVTQCSQVSQGYARNENRVKQRILSGEIEFKDSIWRNLPHARDLVGRLLIRSPLNRGTVYSSMQSAWIADDLPALDAAYFDRVLAGP